MRGWQRLVGRFRLGSSRKTVRDLDSTQDSRHSRWQPRPDRRRSSSSSAAAFHCLLDTRRDLRLRGECETSLSQYPGRSSAGPGAEATAGIAPPIKDVGEAVSISVAVTLTEARPPPRLVGVVSGLLCARGYIHLSRCGLPIECGVRIIHCFFHRLLTWGEGGPLYNFGLLSHGLGGHEK